MIKTKQREEGRAKSEEGRVKSEEGRTARPPRPVTFGRIAMTIRNPWRGRGLRHGHQELAQENKKR
jgi:hypothetical protein